MTLADLFNTEELKGMGIDTPTALIATLKDAVSKEKQTEKFEMLLEKVQASNDLVAQAINRVTMDNLTRQDAEQMQELEKSYKQIGALDPNSLEYRNARQMLEKAYGTFPVELVSRGGLAKMISEPIHPDVTKDYEAKAGIRKAWNRTFMICQLLGGLRQISAIDGKAANFTFELPILREAARMVAEYGERGGKELLDYLETKALDTATATNGSEWIPTYFGADVATDIFLQTQVLSQFATFTMTGSTFKHPWGGSGLAYRMNQATTASQYFTSLGTESDPTTGTVTFTAQKIGAPRFYSEEMDSDSMVPVVDFLLKDLIRAHAWALEDWAINGSTLLNDLDNQGTDTNRLFNNTADAGDGIRLATGAIDARNAGNGIRKMAAAQTGTRVDASNSATNFGTLLRKLRAKMGEAAASPDRNFYLLNTDGHIHLMNDANYNTLEKFGPNAPVLTGQMASFDGHPVVLSRFQKAYYNASGVFDNVTTNRTLAHLVNKDSIKVGLRMQPTLFSDFQPLAQQSYLLMVQRLDIQKILPATAKTCAELYNIPLV